jgi:glutamyl-tRNA synthetase
VAKGTAYYCFCDKARLESLNAQDTHSKYDRHCLNMSKAEVTQKLASGASYVIRQMIPPGTTTFEDAVYGTITVENSEMEDQVLIKSDGLPTYNFANVVDDHLMAITHVLRGSEYLTSTPKYNLLYDAFGWEKPVYMHLPLIVNANGEKLSKRKGDMSFEDLLAAGFLPEAIINYIVLLGWSPRENREFFTLDELVEAFDPAGLSKAPSVFDITKLTWMNGEYIKKMPPKAFTEMAMPFLQQAIKRHDVALNTLAAIVQSRVNFAKDVTALVDFIDALPSYTSDLYVHQKMKTTPEIALDCLKRVLPALSSLEIWTEESTHACLMALVRDMGLKNGQVLWPVRTALSGKPSSPCGASELLVLLGKADSLARIEKGIQLLEKEAGKI